MSQVWLCIWGHTKLLALFLHPLSSVSAGMEAPLCVPPPGAAVSCSCSARPCPSIARLPLSTLQAAPRASAEAADKTREPFAGNRGIARGCSRTNVPVVLAACPGCDTGLGAEGSALVRSWCAETGRHRRTHPKTSAIGMRSSPLCTAQTVPLRVGYVEEYSSLMQRAIRERKSQPKDFIEPED